MPNEGQRPDRKGPPRNLDPDGPFLVRGADSSQTGRIPVGLFPAKHSAVARGKHYSCERAPTVRY